MIEQLPTRIKSKIDMTGDCWEWTAARDRFGYGRTSWNGQSDSAHRAVYELLVGPIPDGLEIDHLCRNRGCVNPDHLEAVTHLVNVRRGDAPSQTNRHKTHCKRDHLLSGSNLIVDDHGWRQCRTCIKDNRRQRYLRQRTTP